MSTRNTEREKLWVAGSKRAGLRIAWPGSEQARAVEESGPAIPRIPFRGTRSAERLALPRAPVR